MDPDTYRAIGVLDQKVGHISEKLDLLSEQIADLRASIRADHDSVIRFCAMLDEIKTVCGLEHKHINNRINGMSALQSAIAVVLSAVAGYLGVKM